MTYFSFIFKVWNLFGFVIATKFFTSKIKAIPAEQQTDKILNKLLQKFETLEKKNENLEQKIETLEKKNESYEQKIETLEKRLKKEIRSIKSVNQAIESVTSCRLDHVDEILENHRAQTRQLAGMNSFKNSFFIS